MDNGPYLKRARKRLIILVVLAAAGGLLCWYIWPYLPSLTALLVRGPAALYNSAEQFATKEVAKDVSLPPPLRNETPAAAPAPKLTTSGIILNTNNQRKLNGGLPALSENTTLDAIATARAADMFQKQYFAHVAPDGGNVETVARTLGYEYLAIGENIALGVFAGDADLVDAWMASPGHRANILNKQYTQIGVAAREGVFDGRKTWIAVQIFGRPASACPAIDANLKTKIDTAEAQLAEMQTQIQTKKAEMDAIKPKRGSAYNQKVDEYNALVRQYNILLEQTKLQVDQYNAEVTAFNLCVQSV